MLVQLLCQKKKDQKSKSFPRFRPDHNYVGPFFMLRSTRILDPELSICCKLIVLTIIDFFSALEHSLSTLHTGIDADTSYATNTGTSKLSYLFHTLYKHLHIKHYNIQASSANLNFTVLCFYMMCILVFVIC